MRWAGARVWWVYFLVAPALAGDAVAPFELDDPPVEATAIDAPVRAQLTALGIRPANPSSDDVYLRRVFLDLCGTLPQPEEWLAFTDSREPGKRAALVDSLMTRPEFVDYWALRWCDILRVKAEFPINLWPNAVQAYHRWLHDAVAANLPYDQFARALLTSSGSNFRDPPVNFYRAVQGNEPENLAAAVSLTFLGTRWESWTPAQREGLATVFSRVAFKPTREWKEEIVYNDPAPTEPLVALLPDGSTLTVAAGDDPRIAFADWLIRPDNPWFARAAANRMWAWMMGRGVVHEPDDLRADNPPVNPELLDLLAAALVDANWDQRALMRLICASRTYQQSAIPRSAVPEAEARFAHYVMRRIDAEILADILRWFTGEGESYSSNIPEPFTWIPYDQHTVALADGSITSPFLELFGRPARDTGLLGERNNQPSDAQRLHLLNSSDVQRRLERGGRLHGCIAWAGGSNEKLVAALYVNLLSREPTAAEAAIALEYFQGAFVNRTQAAVDLAWALINSKEFLYRH